MTFNWPLLFLLLPPLLVVVLADNNSQRQRQFNCPNGGEPKADERTGKPLQCLPGRRSSSAICGLHHSCFFSGFNYQCCPSLSEDFVNQQSLETEHRQQPTADDDMAENECPAGSFSVFGPEGALLRCGRLRSQTECSKSSMFCHVGVSMQICCERFESDGPHHAPHQTQVSGEVIVPTSSREAVWHSTDGQSRGEADAVGHSIDKGEADAVGHSIDRGEADAVEHSTDGGEAGAVGHSTDGGEADAVGHSTDGGEADAVGHSTDGGEADAVGHSTDGGEADAVGHSTDRGEANGEESKRQPQLQPPPHGTSSNRSTSPMPTLDMKDGKSSAESVRPSLAAGDERPPPSQPKKIIQQAAKTAQHIGQDEDEDEHGTGSKEQKSNTNNFNKFNNNNNKEEEYAPTKLLKEFSNVADEPAQQHRTASQQYILEKISDGWPYDDKFYRPTNNNNEDIFVMRKRGRPSAIVYLPN